MPLLPISAFPQLDGWAEPFPGKDTTIGKDSAGLSSPECGEVEVFEAICYRFNSHTPGLAYPF